MKVRQLKIEAPQRALIAEAGDNEAVSRADMRWMLQQMQIIRAFEEKILECHGLPTVEDAGAAILRAARRQA